MIWQNPWAWLGLVSIALPVIIHLLGRGHARVHRFPTLRFIDPSRLLPTRRTRLNDLLLLAVRVAILVAATMALAQPLLRTQRRSAVANAALARVVIVDTSGNDRTALDSVNGATHLARDATIATILSVADPAADLPGAVAWLETQPMRGEIAILSRFSTGALDSLDVATIPSRYGIRLVRVPSIQSGPLEIRSHGNAQEIIARVTQSADRTDIEWSVAPSRNGRTPTILAGAAEQRRADAARSAAATIPVALPLDSVSSIVVVTPGYEGRAGLLANTIKPKRAWMMDIVARLAADSTFLDAARRATIVSSTDSANTLVVARTDSGRPVVLAGEHTENGREQLVLYSLADAGSLATATLLSSVARATSLARPSQWLEPSTMSDAALSGWQRAPSEENRTTKNGSETEDSDGRWLWIAALALLALETWLRRERRIAVQQMAHDRAA